LPVSEAQWRRVEELSEKESKKAASPIK